MQTINSAYPTFVSAPEIARGAGVTVNTVTAALKRAGQTPDAVVRAGRLTMPLFSLPRLNSLIGIVNGETIPPQIEAR
jgi:hypothetical protein